MQGSIYSVVLNYLFIGMYRLRRFVGTNDQVSIGLSSFHRFSCYDNVFHRNHLLLGQKDLNGVIYVNAYSGKKSSAELPGELCNRLNALSGEAPAPNGSDRTLCGMSPENVSSALVTSRR